MAVVHWFSGRWCASRHSNTCVASCDGFMELARRLDVEIDHEKNCVCSVHAIERKMSVRYLHKNSILQTATQLHGGCVQKLDEMRGRLEKSMAPYHEKIKGVRAKAWPWGCMPSPQSISQMNTSIRKRVPNCQRRSFTSPCVSGWAPQIGPSITCHPCRHHPSPGRSWLRSPAAARW